ncbi:hypothetical protein COCOBI_17-3240 [Coccomyxa sp. Obi]|nr:hypothetical protein COCOBI_17-3240 [Coccomyxa sp. Obi]
MWSTSGDRRGVAEPPRSKRSSALRNPQSFQATNELLIFHHKGSSTMNSKTRVAVCLLFVAALLASSATATVSNTVESDNVAALPNVLPVVNLGRKLASDGGKAGPPPVKCTYSKGPKGINKVCS